MPVTEKQMANLIPQNKRSQRERKEVARKGAEATNRVKAEKRTLRQCAEIIGAMPDIKTAEELKSQGIDVDNVTQNMGVIFGLYKSAKRGNSNSARVLAELVGELKQQQTNVNVTTNVNPYANLTEDELRKLAQSE